MKATEQCFPVVLFIMLCKMVQTFESVDEILTCDHLNATVHHTAQGVPPLEPENKVLAGNQAINRPSGTFVCCCLISHITGWPWICLCMDKCYQW